MVMYRLPSVPTSLFPVVMLLSSLCCAAVIGLSRALHAFSFALDATTFSAHGISSGTLTVGPGVELAFLDSGAPSASKMYHTIFAIHGMGFGNTVFAKILAKAPAANVRFVAINRRDYNGSTPYSTADIQVLTNGTDVQKASFLQARGLEFATFIDSFMTKFSIPNASADGKSGGIGLLGWSLGNSFTVSILGNLFTYPEPLQRRLAENLRSLIMQEPPSVSIGTPTPPQNWSPLIDTSIPAELRTPGFVQWITAYFQHGDLSTRDVNVLSFVLPTITRIPTVFNMSVAQLAGMTNVAAVMGSDGLIIVNIQPQLLTNYRMSLFNTTIRNALPLMQVTEFTGDITANFGIVAFWSIQDDDAAAGGGHVDFDLVSGANHFLHWDDPDRAISIYTKNFH